AVVTPARNEAADLARLGAALAAQVQQPDTWLIVDNGSSDSTPDVARDLVADHTWIRLMAATTAAGKTRAQPILQAFHAGVAALSKPVDVVVKLDADISMAPDYFRRLLHEFEFDSSLGIASGSCFEQANDGTWRQRHGTGSGVWGGCRAYRWACLQEVLPLEQRMGWDSIDLFKAHLRGWRTAGLPELPFKHHRPEGSREGSETARWAAQGEAAHYMGYRFSYLLVRSCYRALRHPAALAIVGGYVGAAIRCDPVCPDPEVRAYVRSQQRLRRLPER